MQNNTINLAIDGMGIILYSDWAVQGIVEGEDYLESNYWEPKKVVEHIYQGSIVGFCTGSPGDYILHFHSGYPTNEFFDNHDFSLELGIRVIGGCFYVRDLYDLMEWIHECPDEQRVMIVAAHSL